jgi:hypothetical protein
MGTLTYLVYLVICVVVVLDILRGSLATDKKVIWMVVVIFLPVLGVLLYYFLGRK